MAGVLRKACIQMQLNKLLRKCVTTRTYSTSKTWPLCGKLPGQRSPVKSASSCTMSNWILSRQPCKRPQTFISPVSCRAMSLNCKLFHVSALQHKETNDASDFKEVLYRHRNMRAIRFMNNIKIFQTLATVIYVPWGFYLHSMNALSDLVLYAQTGLTLFALIMLYAMSYYLRRIVGAIYMNQAEDQLKVAHLTFWGQRQDDVIHVADVVPFGEDMESRIERFKKIKLTAVDGDSFYYLDTKAGDFRNVDKFEDVFGNLLRSAY